jgi:hypothetical protein
MIQAYIIRTIQTIYIKDQYQLDRPHASTSDQIVISSVTDPNSNLLQYISSYQLMAIVDFT